MGLFNLFKNRMVEIVCPVCKGTDSRACGFISAMLQETDPVFACNFCSADITAAVLKIPVVSEMASALETARIQNNAAKESLEELREPGRKEDEARREQTALVKLESDYGALVKRTGRIEDDNSQLREQNQQLRSGMEAAAAHVRLLKTQLEAVVEPHISFFIEVGDAKTGTRVGCKGCHTELAMRCPKCGYYHVLTVEMRGKDNEILLLRRLESNAAPAKRDPMSGYYVVGAAGP